MSKEKGQKQQSSQQRDKTPQDKKRNTMFIYVAIVCVAMILIQVVAVPFFESRQVKKVDYGTFLTMLNEKKIDTVQLNLEDEQLIFTAKTADSSGVQTYKTGRWPHDPDLVKKLEESGASFQADIPKRSSPFLLFILSFLLPILFFVGIGYYLNKRLREKLSSDDPTMTFGGGFSSPFGGAGGFGKSGAKIVAETETGVSFKDVAKGGGR